MEIENAKDDAFFYKELLKYLAEAYKKCSQKITFPAPASQLHAFYYTELSNELKEDLYGKFFKLHQWNPFDVELLLEHQVLNPLKTKNFYRLKKLIRETITKFLAKIDLFSNIYTTDVLEQLQDQIEKNDTILLDIANALMAAKKEKNKPVTDFTILNKETETIFMVVNVYQQLLYSKYEMTDLYLKESKGIREETIQYILNFAREKYSKVFNNSEKEFKAALGQCKIEFKETFQENLTEVYAKNPTVNTYVSIYKASRNYLFNIFKDNVTNKLGDMPNDIFLSIHQEEIDQHVKGLVVIDKLYKYLIQDSALFKNTIYQDMLNIYTEFNFAEGKISNLFDPIKLNGKANLARLFSITILTDFLDLDENRYEIYFQKLYLLYLQHIFPYIEEYPLLEEYFQLINTRDNCIKNRPLINDHLEFERSEWFKSTAPPENLYAMMCLFFVFNQIDLENAEKTYTAHDRYMLKCIFRNLSNGENRFSNFQILCGMEALIMEVSNLPVSKIAKENPLEDQDILSKIRNTLIKSFSEHSNHENQFVHLQGKLGPHLKRPTKFFLEKVSDQKICSKVITICVSGFTSEDFAKSDEWKNLAHLSPFTEVFALNWSSNTMKNLYTFLLKEVSSFMSANRGILLGFALVKLRPILLGFATYQTFKGIKDDLWGKAYEEAVTTGIYLAHVLAKTDLFKDYVINLAGFSLGTLVVMSCIWELEKLGRKDMIYDVLLMGGVVNASDFNKSALNVVSHQIINCHCKTDYILKFILKMVNYSTNPIGLGPILCADKKVKNVDVSKHVEGHTKYREHLQDILARVDFNEDLNYLL